MDGPAAAGASQISRDFSSNEFQLLAAQLRAGIDKRLAELLPFKAEDPGLKGAIAHGAFSPGKRLRPLITLLACRQCGGDEAEALDAACAVEMIHAASLIVDDLPCMDNARLRRNGLATHVAYGEGVGILAAITLVNEAFRALAAMDRVDLQKRMHASEKLADAIGVNGLAGGQERDLSRTGGEPSGGMREVEQSHLEKTGALFAAAAGIGAVIAGARAVEIDAMEQFGSALGLAYQTFDDVIDVECDANATGKDSGQDENRTTVVTLMGARKANLSASHWINEAASAANRVDCGAGTPLADLARAVEAKFKALTRKN